MDGAEKGGIVGCKRVTIPVPYQQGLGFSPTVTISILHPSHFPTQGVPPLILLHVYLCHLAQHQPLHCEDGGSKVL